jgi:hypothetical protein
MITMNAMPMGTSKYAIRSVYVGAVVAGVIIPPRQLSTRVALNPFTARCATHVSAKIQTQPLPTAPIHGTIATRPAVATEPTSSNQSSAAHARASAAASRTITRAITAQTQNATAPNSTRPSHATNFFLFPKEREHLNTGPSASKQKSFAIPLNLPACRLANALPSGASKL